MIAASAGYNKGMEIPKKIKAEMSAQQIPGLAVAIIKGDRPEYIGYHGFANLEHHVPVSADTVWEIASVTKPFTAQAVLLAMEEGRLELDHRLFEYLPTQMPTAWAEVTIRHILAHQSGIPSYTEADSYWALAGRDKSHTELLDLVRNKPLNFRPGERHAYDNTGYYLLGLLLESLYGKPYGEIISQKIASPLGLSATQANDYHTVIPGRAAGYDLLEGEIRNKPYYSPSNTFSAGLLLASLPDLIRWQVSLKAGLLLKAETLTEMLRPYPSLTKNERENRFSMGLGWFLVDHPRGRFIGHNGSIVGFASAFIHLPAPDLTLILLCNQSAVTAPHEILFRLVDGS